MTIQILFVIALASGLLILYPRKAYAHCDTMDGPAVKDGEKALETGNINYAYKWIFEEYEEELKEIFELALKARKLGQYAKEVSDRWFL